MQKSDKPSKQNTTARDIQESFIANINHAFRTPLNGLIGMTDMLSKTGLDDGQMKYANIIRETTQLLMLQMDNVIELSKTEDLTVNNTAFLLPDLLKSSIQSFIPMAVKKGIFLTIDIAENIPEVVTADADKLAKIIENLISCSLKYAERGKIVVKVTLILHEDDNNSMTAIRFTFENSKVLYEALRQANYPHTDIGDYDLREFGEVAVSLAAVQKLLASMGSDIHSLSTDATEPVFYFDLPIENRAQVSSDDLPSCYRDLRKHHALVLQDNLLDMSVMTQCLYVWQVPYRVIDDMDKIKSVVDEAKREGRSFTTFINNTTSLGADDLKSLTPSFEKVITIGKVKTDKQAEDDNITILYPPIYSEELLSCLTPIDEDTETAWSARASEHVTTHGTTTQYPPLHKHIVLVEDDFVSRMYATELLEGFGCSVTTAEDGESALLLLKRFPDVDAIVMDCMMPRLDGYQTTEQLRRMGYKDTPIIALTANTLQRDQEKCLAAGMSDYITKPVKEGDLYNILTKYLPRT